MSDVISLSNCAIEFNHFFQVSDVISLSNCAVEFKQFFQVSDIIISLSNSAVEFIFPSVRRSKFKQPCRRV